MGRRLEAQIAPGAQVLSGEITLACTIPSAGAVVTRGAIAGLKVTAAKRSDVRIIGVV
jgi:hypothetical protein